MSQLNITLLLGIFHLQQIWDGDVKQIPKKGHQSQPLKQVDWKSWETTGLEHQNLSKHTSTTDFLWLCTSYHQISRLWQSIKILVKVAILWFHVVSVHAHL